MSGNCASRRTKITARPEEPPSLPIIPSSGLLLAAYRGTGGVSKHALSCSLTVTRGVWGTSNISHVSGVTVTDITGGAVAITSLSAAITTTSQTSVSLTSTTGFGVGDFIQVGTEIMKVTGGGNPLTNPLTVIRGARSTTASTYSSGTTVKDVTHDRIFVGVAVAASSEPCTTPSGGCSLIFDVTAPPLSVGAGSTAVASLGLNATGGTSGIVIDNSNTSVTGASQVYYSTIGNATCTTVSGTNGCAVQASQAGLQ